MLIIILGHGSPSTLDVVMKTTKDYIVYMRDQIKTILENDDDEQDAYKVVQSTFFHLETFHQLSLQNTGRVCHSMEFE